MSDEIADLDEALEREALKRDDSKDSMMDLINKDLSAYKQAVWTLQEENTKMKSALLAIRDAARKGEYVTSPWLEKTIYTAFSDHG